MEALGNIINLNRIYYNTKKQNNHKSIHQYFYHHHYHSCHPLQQHQTAILQPFSCQVSTSRGETPGAPCCARRLRARAVSALSAVGAVDVVVAGAAGSGAGAPKAGATAGGGGTENRSETWSGETPGKLHLDTTGHQKLMELGEWLAQLGVWGTHGELEPRGKGMAYDDGEMRRLEKQWMGCGWCLKP